MRVSQKLHRSAQKAHDSVGNLASKVKVLEGSASAMRDRLTAEQKQPTPDPKVLKALEGALKKLTGSLDQARGELKAASKEATRATKKAAEANTQAIADNVALIGQGAQLHQDAFAAEGTARALDQAGSTATATTAGFEQLAKALEATAKDPARTPAERQQAKDALPKVKDTIASLKTAEQKLAQAEQEAEAKAKKLGRKADALDPKVAEAKAELKQQLKDLVGLDVANAFTQVGAGKTLARADFVSQTLNSPNADRAMETLRALEANPSPRITPDVTQMLVKGVSESRTTDVNGREGILGQAHAQRAADALAGMPDPQYAKIRQALEKAESPAEQALILKAVAARKDAFTGPKTGNGAVQMMNAQDEVTNFAARIRGMDRAELVQQTSVLDLDAQKGTSDVNPENLTNNPYDGTDTTDNDGLFQHLTQSCAPTTAQMLTSEADPVFALALNDAGLAGIAPDSAVTKGQQDALTAAGGNAIDRMTEAKIEDWREKLMRDTKDNTKITDVEADAVWKLMTDGDTLTPNEVMPLLTGLAKMRAGNKGSPTDRELSVMRMGGQAGSNAATVIGDMSQGVTGERLAERNTKMGPVLTPAFIEVTLQKVNARLRGGHDVAMGIGAKDGSVGHEVLITDVRGSGKKAEYLISDPASGRTGWVSGQKLASDPSWMEKFGLHHEQVVDFLID